MVRLFSLAIALLGSMLASMMCLLCLNALWVTHIRHDEKLVTLAILFGLRPVGVVSNIHPSRRNLVT